MEVDALVTPTTPLPAVKTEDDVQTELRGRKVGTFPTFTRYTTSISVVGVPSITVPAGWTSGGLPVGIQFVGPYWGEPRIIQIAYAYQESTKWYRSPRLG